MSEQPNLVTPESLAEEYASQFAVMLSKRTRRATSREDFLAGYCANAERMEPIAADIAQRLDLAEAGFGAQVKRAADLTQRLDLAEETLKRHGFEFGVVNRMDHKGAVVTWVQPEAWWQNAQLQATIERLTRERDWARNSAKFYSHQWGELSNSRNLFQAELAKAREEIARLKALSCMSGGDAMAKAIHERDGREDNLRAELSAANAAREKAKELDTKRLVALNRIHAAERDDLRRQLEELEHRSVDVQAEWAIDRKQRDEALATVEAMGKILDRLHKRRCWDFGEVSTTLSTPPSDHLRALKLEVAERAFREGMNKASPPQDYISEAWLESEWLASATRKALQMPSSETEGA